MRSGLMMGEGVLRSSVPFLILFLKKIKENTYNTCKITQLMIYGTSY